MSSINDNTSCTDRCRSLVHGNTITDAITKRSVSDEDLCAFLNYLCINCDTVKDDCGRTALHVASACGRINLLRWLIKNRHANLNLKDEESGYTSLHRSIFYGKIDVAVELIKLGANTTLLDSDCLTMLEHAMKDSIHKPNYQEPKGEVYFWGQNTNNSMGPNHSRNTPELMDVFHKKFPMETAVQVCLEKFHSVIVTESGQLYTCGHGLGGRLGLGTDQTVMEPKNIAFNDSSDDPSFTQACASRDHSLFLTSEGVVYSCGLNTNKVLGIQPTPNFLLAPKMLRTLASKSIKGITAGRFHSVAWNSEAVFTWGLNAGQLGHQLIGSDTKYVTLPKSVKNLSDMVIQTVCASDGATAVYTKKGDVFILHEYQCRKIASRLLDIKQISVTGGKIDSSIDAEIRKESSKELKVIALTRSGNLLLWQETDPQLCRCIYSLNRAFIVTQVKINIKNIAFITKDGEAFLGEFKVRKRKALATGDNRNAEKNKANSFHTFLDKEDCVSVKLTKVPRIHRAVFIESDSKGDDFCVIQEHPYKTYNFDGTIDYQLQNDLGILLEEANEDDSIHDIIFQIENRRFPAHQFIIAQSSQYLHKLVLDKKIDNVVVLKNTNPDLFEEFLLFCYTGTCNLLKCGECPDKLAYLCEKKENIEIVYDESDNQKSAFKFHKNNKSFKSTSDNTNNRKFSNSIRMFQEMAKKFGCTVLNNLLSNLDMHKKVIKTKSVDKVKINPMTFDRMQYANFCDVTIKCSDGKEIDAHKCVLFSRIDYFNSMFSVRWKEDKHDTVQLQFPKNIVEALLEFIYTDNLVSINKKESDFLMKLLILADQLFVQQLKTQCELLLSFQVNLKNCIQHLTFAHIYNAPNFKKCCLTFIVDNLAHFLEVNAFNDLDSALVKELSDFYFNKKPEIWCRVITPYSTAVSDDEIIAVGAKYPVNFDFIEPEKVQVKVPHKRRSKTLKSSFSEKTVEFDTSLDSLIQFPDGHHTSVADNNSFETPRRIKAIASARDAISNERGSEQAFVNLNKLLEDEINSPDTFLNDFPELSGPPVLSSSYSKSPHKYERYKMSKLSQKQRKRLSSESKENVVLQTEVQKNPWKILPETIADNPKPIKSNIGAIISDERKQKGNLMKITSKLLVYTQMEDKAIVELQKFYNVDNIDDEFITVERVTIGNVASPVWVPRTQTR